MKRKKREKRGERKRNAERRDTEGEREKRREHTKTDNRNTRKKLRKGEVNHQSGADKYARINSLVCPK